MTPREQAPALSVQLQHTAHLLDRVMQGESTTALLAGLPSSLRPGIQALLLSVLRHAALARAANTHLVQKPPARPVMAPSGGGGCDASLPPCNPHCCRLPRNASYRYSCRYCWSG